MTTSYQAPPINNLDVPLIIRKVIRNIITHDTAQQLVAYTLWQQRVYDRAKGSAVGDWYEAASILNMTSETEELDVLPW